MQQVVDILSEAKEQGLYAFVSGGFVRDTILGKPIKDIDVFVLHGKRYKFESIDTVLPDVSANNLMLPLKYGNYRTIGGSGTNIREDVLNIEQYPYSQVDVIYLNHITPENACYNFDCSICQCYAILNDNGELEIRVSKDFMDYVNNNIIYLYSDIQTTDSHIDRVKNKYPDAIFVEKNVDKSDQGFMLWEHKQTL